MNRSCQRLFHLGVLCVCVCTLSCVNGRSASAQYGQPADDRMGKYDRDDIPTPSEMDPRQQPFELDSGIPVDQSTANDSRIQMSDLIDMGTSFDSDIRRDADLGDELSQADAAPSDDDAMVADVRPSEPICARYDSPLEDFSPVQQVGAMVPDEALLLDWIIPAPSTNFAPFAGQINQAASHEGVDYIHADPLLMDVWVQAASAGIVVYVRTGCAQSSMFEPNRYARECGSGWGNHVIVQHLPTVFTRYAHLATDGVTVSVGDRVELAEPLGLMGNTGRSELRHLHFELGMTTQVFDACDDSQSFERVYDPESIGL